jgi:hypothetical protein
MNEPAVTVDHDNLPVYITGPAESDILLIAVAVALVGVVVGFGAALPDGQTFAHLQLRPLSPRASGAFFSSGYLVDCSSASKRKRVLP